MMRNEYEENNGKVTNFMDEFGGWNVEALVNDEEFMGRQRNRMMYNTLVLKGRTGRTLEEYLKEYDPNNEEGFYSRGLRFIADMINTGMEENGETVDNVTADELHDDPVKANNYLRKAIGIEAYTTMLLREESSERHLYSRTLEDVVQKLREKMPNMDLDDELMDEVNARLIHLSETIGTRPFGVLRSLEPEGFEIFKAVRNIMRSNRNLREFVDNQGNDQSPHSMLSWDSPKPISPENLVKKANRIIRKFNKELAKISNLDPTISNSIDTTDMELIHEMAQMDEINEIGIEGYKRMYNTFLALLEQPPKQLQRFEELKYRFSLDSGLGGPYKK